MTDLTPKGGEKGGVAYHDAFLQNLFPLIAVKASMPQRGGYMALHFSAKRWQDQLILLLGVWLFVSPWVLGIPPGSLKAANACAVGAVMVVMAAFDLHKTYLWAVAVNILLGSWLAISPWVPALDDRGPMMSNSVIVGVAVVMLALWELQSDPELRRQWNMGAG
jgi:hypothetical protein